MSTNHPIRFGAALFVVTISLFVLGLMTMSPTAQAMPSFSRQTGSACTACHTTAFGPNLTPYGRDFKLNGYVWGNDQKEGYVPPISAMLMGSFTNTKKDIQPNPPSQDGTPNHFNTNNNFTFDQASLFYAGRIWDKVGAFSQLTYNGVADSLAMDNTDVRFANRVDVFGQDVVYGISANNKPTVQDLWNTTSAWGFPYNVAPFGLGGPSASAMLDGGLGGVGTGQVGGATLYSMINNLLYVEAGAYASFSRSFLKGTGNYSWDAPLNRIDGGAPYWRVALQKQLGGHYVGLGHYGMIANIHPGGMGSKGTDEYTDLAMDATYQYLGNLDHIFELKTTYIRENRGLRASVGLGNLVNRTNYLNTFKINASYTYAQTYSLTFGYNKTWTRSDLVYDATAHAFSGGGNNGSEYFTTELAFVPFGKDYSLLSSLMNLRMSLQYIGYTQFAGSQKQVGDNNVFLLNGWLSF